MKVKWHGKKSTTRTLKGGGPQGATFALWEYLAQSNSNADCVDPEYRFKFVDDLTVLKKINLLTIGLSSFNSKASVPADIPSHNKYIDAIQEQTQNQKMILNQKKTKVMIFNYTDNYQFTTRLSLNNANIEVVNKAKRLGVIVSNDLKWEENTQYLVKKANARLELLRKIASSRKEENLCIIHQTYPRTVLCCLAQQTDQ